MPAQNEPLFYDNELHRLIDETMHGHRRYRAEQAPAANAAAKSEPAVLLVERLFLLGVQLRATDIHLEPTEDAVKIRFRIDGVLLPCREFFPLPVWTIFLGRLKILAKMDTAQNKRPADGHIIYQCAEPNRVFDMRVASVPSKYGESLVIRMLPATPELRKITELNLLDNNLKKIKSIIRKPQGLFIVTGPMNSGKTTMLYAALSELNSPSVKIATVEDPVEITLPGTCQCEVSDKMSFGEGLRALLRMDCDTLLIGEIRDEVTAQIAVRAALTGHRIFTTLHASNSLNVLLRLQDLGISPNKIAACLTGVLSQRLVRKLCPHCCRKHIEADGKIFYEKGGCDICHGTGYLGRIALHEILVPNRAIRSAVSAGVDDTGKLAEMLPPDFMSLWQDGLQKIQAGLTTIEELRRVIDDDGEMPNEDL